MAFDFSKYIPDQSTGTTPPSSVAQYTPGYTEGSNTGLDPAIASQLFNYIGRSDSDANLQDPDVKQKLIDAGLLKSITYAGGEGGEDQQFYALGDKAPSNFAGNISRTDHTPEAQRIIGADSGVAKAQGLLNPNAVYKDPVFGNVTTSANLNRKDPGWDTFWKVAPMLPGLFAMGAPMMFGGLTGAGGATAGGMIGNQTLSDIGGGAIAQGGSATASNLLSNMRWLQKLFPDLVKTGIKGLASNNGKFDFSKYIPTGLQQIAKGLG
jgi:hypothetical protein